MIVHNIHDNKPSRAFDLLKSEFVKITDDDSKENYNPSYAAIPGNFFYDLRNGRYKQGNGNYYVIEINGEYVCSAGWHRYDSNTALLLTRMYVGLEYRNYQLGGKVILPFLLRLQRTEKAAPSQWPALYKKFKPIGQHKVYHVNQWIGEYQENL